MRADHSSMNLLRQAWRNSFWFIFGAVLLWDAWLVTPLCFTPDWAYISAWAKNIQAGGLGLAYEGTPGYNYPPLMAYLLWLFALGLGSAAALQKYLYFYKLFPLAFDFAAAALAVKWAGDRRREVIYLLLLIANPLYIFNSYTWGQIDSTYCALVFFSLYAMTRDWPVRAALFYVLAVNFKIQALLFFPLFSLVLLWKYKNPWRLKDVAVTMGAAALLQLVILLPFLQAGEVGRMIDVLKNPVNHYPVVSMNAFNFWQLFYGSSSFTADDSVRFLGAFSAQQIGLALFFGFSLLVLAPPCARILRGKFRGRPMAWSEENLFLLFGLVPVGFFFFCTQMHERYAQPAILFFAVYAFRTRRYYLLILLFLAYGLNVEYVFQYYLLHDFWRHFFDARLVAALYAVLIGLSLRWYFRSLPEIIPAPASPQPADGL